LLNRVEEELVDEPLNKAHQTNECPGCSTVERNELRAELRHRISDMRDKL